MSWLPLCARFAVVRGRFLPSGASIPRRCCSASASQHAVSNFSPFKDISPEDIAALRARGEILRRESTDTVNTALWYCASKACVPPFAI